MKKIISLIAISYSLTALAAVSPLTNKAISLLNQLDSSDYGTRTVCIVGKKVYGIVPGSHWSVAPSFAEGTVSSFPERITRVYDSSVIPVSVQSSKEELVSDIQGVKIYSAPGSVRGAKADICVYESKMVLE